MDKHFELTDKFIINAFGIKLLQIKCTRKIKHADVGDLGGYIEKEDNLSGDAWVSGDAKVYGNAQVSGDAKVSNNNEHCGFDCFGSANRHTHAYKTQSGKVEIICGCFRGSIEEFEEQVKKTHQGNEFERQYMAIAEVIKIKLGLK